MKRKERESFSLSWEREKMKKNEKKTANFFSLRGKKAKMLSLNSA